MNEEIDSDYWGEIEWSRNELSNSLIECDWSDGFTTIKGVGVIRVHGRSDSSLLRIEVTQDSVVEVPDRRVSSILGVPVSQFHLIQKNPNGEGFQLRNR